MTAPAAPDTLRTARRAAITGRALWLGALVLFVALWKFGPERLGWAQVYPDSWVVPVKSWINVAMNWLLNDAAIGPVTFIDITRGSANLIAIPYKAALSLFSTGLMDGEGSAAQQILPPVSWLAVIGCFGLFGLWAGGIRLAALALACLGFIVAFGQWQSAMITLASILIAVPLGVVGGTFFGILAHRSARAERLLAPLLDLMQTVPIFAYLVPILFLFGFGPTSAIVATIIYALPPMTRITQLALRAVPSEITDLGHMVGCTERQMTWRVMVPSALSGLMVGVNQVIMLSLNMVIIASMIGAGGLGRDVLAALRRLDISSGVESGLAIVAIAVLLDRLSQAVAARAGQHAHHAAGLPWHRRHPYTFAALALVAVTMVAGLFWGGFETYPKAWHLSMGSFWSDLIKYININYYDQLSAVKNTLLLNVLIPFMRFLKGLPWLGVVGLLALAGWRLGGARLALTVATLATLVAITGQWEKAMITVYLCGISVIIAALIGIPIGILSAGRDGLWRGVRLAIDTLQTLPSFVYLMPFVMLFQVGDFTAMLAIIAYAVAPAIRYTAHGLRQIDPQLIEAGTAAGCTPFQIMTKIKLKLALPEIMLGINQTIMLALSMLVISALVGTRDLGQEVYIALAKADTGRGIVAGLAVAFIAIIADRMISAAAGKLRARLGLAP